MRRQRRVPDLIHSHYADGGLVGAELVSPLGVPMIHTGHSLGRVKLQRLLDQGMKREAIEKRYHVTRRIEAEELALDHAAMVVASTRQEVDEQYALYANHHPERMVVIPPGVDFSRFRAPCPDDPVPPIAAAVDRFLADPGKPAILAISRPDPRKNLQGLVRAFGETPGLREAANLVLVAGTRDDIAAMERGPRRELTELLLLIDRYDLYGHVAYPKRHEADDVPGLYALAAARGGVFVNPALTEPFGLTLLEAAASGLPLIATNDGGPRDILAACGNGVLVDPLDVEAIGRALLDALRDPERLARWARSGAENVRRRYDWRVHVEACLQAVDERTQPRTVVPAPPGGPQGKGSAPLATVERLLVSDIDGTLLGDDEGLEQLIQFLEEHSSLGFGVATGRRMQSAVEVLEQNGLPPPDLIISGVGAEIHYGPRGVEDRHWVRHLDYRWKPAETRELLLTEFADSLALQEEEDQLRHKLSFYVAEEHPPRLAQVRRRLREEKLHAKLVFSRGRFLDVLPIRCSKGNAVRWVANRWGFENEHVLVAGDSGNDEKMLLGQMPAVVVGNHAPELEKLRGLPQIYFAEGRAAHGILEGIRAFGFLRETPRVIERGDPDPEAVTLAFTDPD